MNFANEHPEVNRYEWRTLTNLLFFIHGFYWGRKGTDLGISDDLKRFYGDSKHSFDTFVKKKLNDTGGNTWASIIEFHAMSKDSARIMFYDLLDEFFGSQSRLYDTMLKDSMTTSNDSQTQTDLFDYLYYSRKRPGMYWGGAKSLHDVYHFIHGFCSGRKGTDIGLNATISRFISDGEHGFKAFVVNNNAVVANQTWASIIEHDSLYDSDSAFESFFNLLDEYLKN